MQGDHGEASAGEVMRLHLLTMGGDAFPSVELRADASLRSLYDQAMQHFGGQPCQLSVEGRALPRSDEKLSRSGLRDGSGVSVVLGQPLPEHLVMWLRADELEPGPVASWPDARGGLQVSQAAPEFQPTLVPDALGGHSVVRFGDKGSTFLTLGPESMTGDMVNDGVTIIVAVANVGTPSPERSPVAEQNNMTTDAHEAFLFDVGEVNPDGFGFCVAEQGTASMKFSAHSPTRRGGQHIKPLLPSAPSRKVHTIAYRLQLAGEMCLTWDGMKVGETTTRVKPPLHLSGPREQPLTIGAMSKNPTTCPGRRFVGDIAELLVYNTPLSDEDMAAMEVYFRQRFAGPESA